MATNFNPPQYPESSTKYRTMSLKECGRYDQANNLKAKLTGWGWVSLIRQQKGISRKARRLAKKAQENN